MLQHVLDFVQMKFAEKLQSLNPYAVPTLSIHNIFPVCRNYSCIITDVEQWNYMEFFLPQEANRLSRNPREFYYLEKGY